MGGDDGVRGVLVIKGQQRGRAEEGRRRGGGEELADHLYAMGDIFGVPSLQSLLLVLLHE
jgi:hypothetical protein